MMERLTIRRGDGTAIMKSRGRFNPLGVELLAAYEDTGLTPDEVTAMKMTLMGKSVDRQPTVAAVEVVRCRSCIHDGLTTCPLCYIEQHTLAFVNHDADFYCGKGERRCE